MVIAIICRSTPPLDQPRSKVSSALASTRSGSAGKSGEPISAQMAALPSAYAVRPRPRRASSTGTSRGCCQPTERLPVVDMMLVSDSTRRGRSTAMVCTTIPPIDTPHRWAASIPRWSSRANASAPRSCSVYGGLTQRPANARTSIERVTRPATLVERPVSRLSKRMT